VMHAVARRLPSLAEFLSFFNTISKT